MTKLMGGCAMSENAKRGVVNSRGRHHQIANLSVMDGVSFTTLPLTMAGVVLAGVAAMGALNIMFSMFMLMLPRWIRGRASSVSMLMVWLGSSLGALGWGALASHLGLRTTFLVAAAAQVAIVGVAPVHIGRRHDLAGNEVVGDVEGGVFEPVDDAVQEHGGGSDLFGGGHESTFSGAAVVRAWCSRSRQDGPRMFNTTALWSSRSRIAAAMTSSPVAGPARAGCGSSIGGGPRKGGPTDCVP